MEILKNIKPQLRLILALLLLSGCSSLVPSERKASESVKATEAISTSQDQTIKRTLEVVPEILRPIQGWGSNVSTVSLPAVREQVEITTHSASDAGTKEQARGTSEVSIPLGVKIGLMGVGIALLVGALVWGWRSLKGTAFGQAAQLADTALSNQIRTLRAKIATSVDAHERLAAHATISELEAERGRIAARKK